jgi:arylsulfatase A-like enzyme
LINQRAAAFIRKHADRPFFMYVPHLAVHAPFQPPGRPDPAVTRENMLTGSRRDYAAMLERVDDGVGMILAELRQLGIDDNTLVVLSSDNGGERWSDNSPLFHHKATLWEGGIRVPCLMRWPNTLPKAQTIGQPAITMDLTATFAAAAGASSDPQYPFDGVNLLPFLTGQQPPPGDRTFCWRIDRSNRKMRAVRHGKWKFLDDGGTMELLFDLDADIAERRNLHREHPDKVRELKALLQQWEDEVAREPKSFRVR